MKQGEEVRPNQWELWVGWKGCEGTEWGVSVYGALIYFLAFFRLSAHDKSRAKRGRGSRRH